MTGVDRKTGLLYSALGTENRARWVKGWYRELYKNDQDVAVQLFFQAKIVVVDSDVGLTFLQHKYQRN